MTSYSCYGTSAIRLVDGTLSPDDDQRRSEELEQIINAVASGAARTLLDLSRDEADPDAEVYAEQWHSEQEGWELEALTEESRAKVVTVATKFVTETLDDVLALASRIAWEDVGRAQLWWHDQGMAIYRMGQLLAYSLGGQGVGFSDYANTAEILSDAGQQVNGRVYRGLPGRLELWVTQNPEYSFESPWIDSTEEPCRLHLDI